MGRSGRASQRDEVVRGLAPLLRGRRGASVRFVLVFEDIHLADDALLDFVEHLADWVTGVPILVLAPHGAELLERRPGSGGGKLERRDARRSRR